MSLPLPAWWSAVDRAWFAHALEVASAPYTSSSNEHVLVIGRWYASEDDMVQAVLKACDVVIQIEPQSRASVPPADRRAGLEDLLDEIIVWAYQWRPRGSPPLDQFASTARTAVQQRPGWVSIVTGTEPLPTVDSRRPPVSSPDALPLLTVLEAAERLGVSDDTVYRMGKRGEIRIVSIGPRVKRVPQAEIDRLLATDKYRYR